MADHAEAGLMWAAGGAINGYKAGLRSGVFNCNTAGEFPLNSPLNWFVGSASAMFGVSNGYLKRNTDYRSLLGEIIRKHLGATSNQLSQIIPGYGIPTEYLLSGGPSGVDGTNIRGEVGIL